MILVSKMLGVTKLIVWGQFVVGIVSNPGNDANVVSIFHPRVKANGGAMTAPCLASGGST